MFLLKEFETSNYCGNNIGAFKFLIDCIKLFIICLFKDEFNQKEKLRKNKED